MTLIRNAYTHPYTTSAGRVLAIDEQANINVSGAQEQDAIAIGRLIVMDPDYIPPAQPTPPLDGDWKAPVQSFADLPAAGNRPGDIRLAFDTGAMFRWTGSGWQTVTGSGGGVIYVWDDQTGEYAIKADAKTYIGPVPPESLGLTMGFGDTWTPTQEPE